MQLRGAFNSERRSRAIWLLGVIGAGSVVAHIGLAADSPEKSTTSKPVEAVGSTESGLATHDVAKQTIEEVSVRLKQFQAASDADQPDRGKLIELYQQALEDLRQADEQAGQAAALEKKHAAAPKLLENRKRELAAAGSGAITIPALPADARISTWEEMVGKAEQEAEVAQKTLAALEDESQRRADRRLEIPQALVAVRAKLDELATPDSNAADGESADVTEARRVARSARRGAVDSEIELLEKELQSYDSISDELLDLERAAAARAAEAAEKRAASWRDAIDERRKAESAREAAEAHWAAINAQPALRDLAEENSALTDARQRTATLIDQLADEREALESRLAKLRDDCKAVAEKIKAGGLTDAVGQMLCKERSELMALENDRSQLRQRQQEIARVQLDLYEHRSQLDDLHEIDARVADLRAKLPAAAGIKPEDIRKLLQNKQKYLTELVTDENSYFGDLVELDFKQHQLFTEADDYRTFIDEHIMWVRSTHRLSAADAHKLVEATAWLARPLHAVRLAESLRDGWRRNPVVVVLGTMVLAGWFWLARKLRTATAQWAELSQDNLSNSVAAARRAWQTAGAALVMAAKWPAALWLWGCWIAGGAAGHGHFPLAAGSALQVTAIWIMPLLLCWHLTAADGLAWAHFGWPAAAVRLLRRHLTWMIGIMLPLAWAVAVLNAQTNDAWKDSLGRVLFIACQLSLAAAAIVLLRPPKGAVHQLMTLDEGSWAHRLAIPVFTVLLAIPTLLAILAAEGYYFTALRLACRLLATLSMVLSWLLLQALAARLLTASKRGLVAPDEGHSTQPAHLHVRTSTGAYASIATSADAEVDQSDLQTRRLLRSAAALVVVLGLCVIWADSLPALHFFDSVKLWDLDGKERVTLANLLQAVMISLLTVVAAANLPSLLEIAVLQRMPLDRGVRYALTAVARYALVILGLALAGWEIGIGWPKLQWLAAAISFGLGFGLQEIFANFVSGLIVLLERPIRIGDTVTVGDVTGVVSRIQMRTTTIVDGDRKELIVPNKEFITARLVNWTLSDSVTRLVVRLGLAYGSDTREAERILLRVARDTRDVMHTPPPKAVFMGFGEKSLEFELRVYVSSVDALLSVRHRLNNAIEQAFHNSGVEFAVPLREITSRRTDVGGAEAVLSQKAA